MQEWHRCPDGSFFDMSGGRSWTCCLGFSPKSPVWGIYRRGVRRQNEAIQAAGCLNSLTPSRSVRSRFLWLHPAVVTVIQTLQPFFVTTLPLMKSKLGIIAIASILSACAAPARYDYVKEGASDFQRTDAMSECSYQIRLNKTAAAEQQALLKLCMQGKGYRLKRVN